MNDAIKLPFLRNISDSPREIARASDLKGMTLTQAQQQIHLDDSAKLRRPSWPIGVFLEESDGLGNGWFLVDPEADTYFPVKDEDRKATDYQRTVWPGTFLAAA